MYGKKRKMHAELWYRSLKERNHLEHTDVDGRITVFTETG
jgi:hypothetical protein